VRKVLLEPVDSESQRGHIELHPRFPAASIRGEVDHERLLGRENAVDQLGERGVDPGSLDAEVVQLLRHSRRQHQGIAKVELLERPEQVVEAVQARASLHIHRASCKAGFRFPAASIDACTQLGLLPSLQSLVTVRHDTEQIR